MSKTRAPRRLAIARGLRFACQQCGDCCRDFPISLAPAEVERYEARDWSDLFGYPATVVTTVRRGRVKANYLARKVDGTCLFLGDDNLCTMHARYGEQDKPLACRIFPFTFVEPGEGADRPLLGGHFACSSLANGEGSPVQNRRKDLDKLRTELLGIRGDAAPAPPDRFSFRGRVIYARADVDLLFDLMAKELEDVDRPFPKRILALAKFLSLVAGSPAAPTSSPNATKAVRSFANGVHEQVGRDLLRAPPPPGDLPQRLLFRLLLAFAARRDSAALLTSGRLRRGSRRLSNLLAGLSFMAGTGALTPVGRDRRVILGEVRRKAPVADPYAPEADGALTRYFLAKVSGRFLLDPTFRIRGVLPALGLLLRQYPMVLLFARAACYARGGEALTREDYVSGLRTADWNFGRVAWDAGLLGGLRARLLSDVEATFSLLPWCAGVVEVPALTETK